MEIIIIFLKISILSILVNNFILSKFLGLCPYVGVSKDMDSASGMGLAVIFVMTLASAASAAIYSLVLVPFKLEYLQTIAFILIIATIVQIVEMFIRKQSPLLYTSLGIYLPLITTNCAVLGVSLLNIQDFQHQNLSFFKSVVQGCASGIGFTLALILMAGIRERLQKARIPEPLKGLPITFICAGLMALAFMGFQGLIH